MTAPVREWFSHEQLKRLNALIATIAGLAELKTPEEVAKLRGISVNEL